MTSGSTRARAQACRSLRELFPEQRRVAKAIIERIHQIGLQRSRENSASEDDGVKVRVPLRGPALEYFGKRVGSAHQIFSIDGRRGSGKTTTLLTIYHLLGVMRLDGTSLGDGQQDNGRYLERDVLTARSVEEDLGLHKGSGFRSDHRRLALPLPVVFPERLVEEFENPMEAILAQIFLLLSLKMDEKRDACAMVKKEQGHSKAIIETFERETEELRELQHRLAEKVALGWAFSERHGVETLSRDAFDFSDYVQRRLDYSAASYDRVNIWGDFVESLLRVLECELLVVFLDDTDLVPGASSEILRVIRVYLNHPRIVTVISVSMKSLTVELQAKVLSSLQGGGGRSNDEFHRRTFDHILRHKISEVDHYLSKILPPQDRYPIAIVEKADADFIFNALRPQHRFTSFSDYLAHRATDCRGRGHVGKAFEWWLFWVHYWRIAAFSAREFTSFLELVYDEGDGDINGATPRINTHHHDARGDAPPLGVLLSYGAAAPLRRRLFPDDFDVAMIGDVDLGVVVRTTVGETQIGDGPALPTESFIHQVIDFISDRQVARGRLRDFQRTLLPPIATALAQDFLDQINRTELGVAGYYPADRGLPRNCLYYYQLSRLARVIRPFVNDPPDFALGPLRSAYLSALPRSEFVSIWVRRANQTASVPAWEGAFVALVSLLFWGHFDRGALGPPDRQIGLLVAGAMAHPAFDKFSNALVVILNRHWQQADAANLVVLRAMKLVDGLENGAEFGSHWRAPIGEIGRYLNDSASPVRDALLLAWAISPALGTILLEEVVASDELVEYRALLAGIAAVTKLANAQKGDFAFWDFRDDDFGAIVNETTTEAANLHRIIDDAARREAFLQVPGGTDIVRNEMDYKDIVSILLRRSRAWSEAVVEELYAAVGVPVGAPTGLRKEAARPRKRPT